jgi:hypothetical protein
MPALPLKSEYRPTLGELLSPWWRRSRPTVRALMLVSGVAILAAVVGVVLTVRSPAVSHGGTVPFSFSYRGLYRTSPSPGGYVKVQHRKAGRLEDSFAVGPLLLPRYRGEPGAALALYAAGYVRELAATHQGFELRGEGSTQLDSLPPYTTYNVFYTAEVGGRQMLGRDVLLLAHGSTGARRGVDIAMLTAAKENRQVNSALVVGTKGALEGPLGTFVLE